MAKTSGLLAHFEKDSVTNAWQYIIIKLIIHPSDLLQKRENLSGIISVQPRTVCFAYTAGEIPTLCVALRVRHPLRLRSGQQAMACWLRMTFPPPYGANAYNVRGVHGGQISRLACKAYRHTARCAYRARSAYRICFVHKANISTRSPASPPSPYGTSIIHYSSFIIHYSLRSFASPPISYTFSAYLSHLFQAVRPEPGICLFRRLFPSACAPCRSACVLLLPRDL